jgi:DNA-binding transcriptional regulator YhcF (GntR family)
MPDRALPGGTEREGLLQRVLRRRGGERWRARIDDGSDRSIYEQIIAQVTEAVATGELRPGVRLPTVRQMADDLDVAPGTVARAYTELERQGIVVTERARGTRVADRSASGQGSFEPETLTGLLRPVVVAAFHLGANAAELRAALEEAMRGIFDKDDDAAWV